MRKKIYLASPLFSESERCANELMSDFLGQWFDVFLPQRDGCLVSELVERGASADEAYAAVFDSDVGAIEACDAIVINLDGRCVDEGAAFELGLAYARGKVCVGIRTDVRVLLQWGLNPMVVCPLSRVFRNTEELGVWAAEFAGECKELRSVA